MPRRGENVYKRKDGRWEGRTLKQNGKYQYFYSQSYKGVKEKMKNYKEVQDFRKKKSTTESRDPVILLEAWLVEVSQRVKPSTYESYYRSINNYVIPFFKEEKNPKINEDSVLRFVKTMWDNQRLADSSKKKHLTIFKIALKEILKEVPESYSAIELIRYPKPQDKEVSVFSMSDQKQIEQATRNYKDDRALGILLCFYTGLRLGELCALQQKDIDMEAGTLTVSRTVSRIRHFEESRSKTSLSVGAPKSKKSFRKIPLPKFLLDLITESSLYNSRPDFYLFSSSLDPFDPRNFQKLYKRILKDAQVKDRKFHAIRHTFATRALELGVSDSF